METSQSTLCESALISVRLVTMDYYLISPSTDPKNQVDPIYSMFRSAPIKKVPVLRVFGSTPAGQKCCLHIHGIFPYLYVPMPSGDNPGYLYRLAASLGELYESFDRKRALVKYQSQSKVIKVMI